MRIPDLESMWGSWTREIVGPCVACNGVGFVIAPEGGAVPCDCRREVVRLSRLMFGNVPREFWHAGKREYDGRSAPFIEKARRWHLRRAHAEGSGIVMLGECGVGKTTAAAIILSRAARRSYEVGYITAPDFISTEISGRDDPEFWAWRQELLDADFLVIDEVGKEHRREGSDFASTTFEMLLRRRRGDLKSTIVVTNLEWSRFKDVYGESVWSLMADRSEKFSFPPGDRRIGG